MNTASFAGGRCAGPSRCAGRLAFAVALAVTFWGWGLGGGRAQAQQLTPAQKQDMRLHYDRATRAYDVGKYQEAIEEYQKAYEIGGDPAMLYNIAQAYRLSDQPSEAVRYYRRYLQRQPTAHNRDYVERKIADLEKVLEERRKAAAAAAPPPAPALPRVAALPPASPPAPRPALIMETPTEQKPGPSPEEESYHKVIKIVGWSLIGAGVASGGLAGYFAAVAKDKADKITSLSQMNLEFEAGIANVERNGKNANLAAIVLASASAGLLVAGTVTLIMGRTPSPDGETETARASVEPWLGVGPAGGSVVGAGAHLRF